MVFDFTNFDKIQLIQAVFAYAFPINISIGEYELRKVKGDNVEGLTKEECENKREKELESILNNTIEIEVENSVYWKLLKI